MSLKNSLFFLAALGLLGTSNAPDPAIAPTCIATEQTYREGGFEVSVTRFNFALAANRLVIIMPPTGGTTIIDLSYGKSLCERNINALVVNHWSNDDEYSLDMEIHDRFYRRAQKAIDIILANATEQKIGILGASVGASHAAIASQRTHRISSVFLVVGGAPIASILATSDQKILAEGKAKRFKLFGFHNIEEYEAALEKVIPFEPLILSPGKVAQHLGMAISSNDGTVPTPFQILLHNAWKPSLVLESAWGHIGTIIKTWLCDQNQILNFFDESL